jgi:hypothetical protein
MTLFANVPTRRFGVEVEFVGVSCEAAARAITAAGFPCQYEDYNHATRNTWKVVRDGSLEYHNGNCGELVSPPLSGEAGIEQVRAVLRALVSAGATVNRSCGLHVHVDAGDLSVPQIVSIMRRYQTHQNEINRFMPASRRDSRWAKRISNDLINTVVGCQTPSYLRRYAGSIDRYHAVNVAAYARHGTIEFRQHSASVNNNKVAHWIAFCLHFVATSVTRVTGATPVVAAAASGRGRRPNYSARRVIVGLISRPEGATITQLAESTGYSANTIQSSIFSQLRAFGRVRLTRWSGVYRFTPTMQDDPRLVVWLGNAAAPAPVPAVDVAINDNLVDTLFLGIPNEIASFYNERAMELAPA